MLRINRPRAVNQGIKVLRNVRLCGCGGTQAILLLLFLADSAIAETCLAPQRPFVPSNSQAAREYADIIRNDFELYIRDIRSYFRCLEEERARAFEEAQEVSEEYGRFLEFVQP